MFSTPPTHPPTHWAHDIPQTLPEIEAHGVIYVRWDVADARTRAALASERALAEAAARQSAEGCAHLRASLDEARKRIETFEEDVAELTRRNNAHVERISALNHQYLLRDGHYDKLVERYRASEAELAEARKALKAADDFGRETTRRVLLPPHGACAACGEQVPPAVHHPGCWLRPLLKAVRETFDAAKVGKPDFTGGTPPLITFTDPEIR